MLLYGCRCHHPSIVYLSNVYCMMRRVCIAPPHTPPPPPGMHMGGFVLGPPTIFMSDGGGGYYSQDILGIWVCSNQGKNGTPWDMILKFIFKLSGFADKYF